MVQKFLALASNAFVETIRQPIYGVILLVTALLAVFNVALAAFTLDDDDQLLIDLGLNTLLLSGLFLAAYSASSILNREIENRTVLTVISKPVSRTLLILGKFVGLLAALFVANYLNILVFILATRHGVMQRTSDPWDLPVLVFGFGGVLASLVAGAYCNYFYGRHFLTSTIAFLAPLLTAAVLLCGKLSEKFEVIPFASNMVGGQVLLAAALVSLAVMVMAAVAVAASTRLGTVMTLVTCTLVLAIGIVSDHAFGQHEETSTAAFLLYRALPNIGPFWVVDALMATSEDSYVPFSYVGYVAIYAILLTAGILNVAIVLFQKREVG